MSTKLFFFDLDGTLLNTEKQITPDTYAALREWHAHGHRIAISSGRPLRSIVDTIYEQHLDVFSPYAIAFNGAQIHALADGRDICKKTLTLAQVLVISRMVREAGLYCHTYDDQDILTPKDGEVLHYYTPVVRIPFRLLPDFPDGVTERPCKMLCIDLRGPDALDRLSGQIRVSDALGGNITAMRSNDNYLEIFPSDAGKGAAVTALAEHLRISRNDTFAAGDAPNDISMLEAAGCGVAMCSGHAQTIAAADVVTAADNDHDGLAPVLRANLT